MIERSVFTEYFFIASSKSLSSTEKENRSFGNERDKYARFSCGSTGRFSLSSSAMTAVASSIVNQLCGVN